MKWNARQGLITLFAAAAIGLLGTAENAHAGTYSVSQCNGGTGAGISPQWSANLNGSWPAQNLCPGGLQVAGMGIDGVFAQWMLVPPSGVTISSVVFGGQGLGTPQVPVYAMLCAADANPVCTWSDYENMSGGPQTHTLSGAGSTSMRFGMGSTCCTHYTSSAYSSIWNLAFTLSESTAPSIGVPSGNVNINGWNRGNLTGGITGSDAQSGVQSLIVSVDSNPTGPGSVSNPQACSDLQIVPCPTSVNGWAPTISTSGLADGAHTLRYSARDYAGNTAQSSAYGFKVDNTRPAMPSDVVVPGTNGWVATNDFDLSWANSGETVETATQSGIAAVKVDVEPTLVSQANPASVVIPIGTTVAGISSTINSLSNVAVPAKGAWRLKLATVDRAGNESPVGDGSNGEADGVFEIGFDDTPPAAPQGQANGWISRQELADGYDQEWTINKDPFGAPICGYASSITGAQSDPGTAINLPGDVDSMELPANLTEGSHWVNLRSVTCANVASPQSNHIEAPVDLTDPVGSYSGVENDGWYKDNQVVSLVGTDALSGMVGAGAAEPIVGGAYLAYSMDGSSEERAKGGGTHVMVTGEGLRQIVFAPVDLAGNRAQAKTVRFGIDASDPTGSFNIPDPDRPTLLQAPLADSVSGVAAATIEIRRKGSGDWQTLPTSIADTTGVAIAGYPTAAIVSARFPDTSLPKGTYEVRVRAQDRAGNSLVANTRKDGAPMTISNPTRGGVALSAGLSKAKRVCTRRKGVKCVKKHRGKVVFSNTHPKLDVGFKRGAVVQGFLSTTTLEGMPRQPIEIYATAKGKSEVLLGHTSTRGDGSYLFKIKPGISRKVRVYFPGTELREDASASVHLGTAARLTMRVSRQHARTGQTVKFTGKVQSFDGSMPAAGKIVALQFRAGKKWRPAVAIVHTNAVGRFQVKYRFDGRRIKARIVFRVHAPTEDSWNHSSSSSQRVTLRLN